MSSLVETFSLITLLVVGLPSLEGNHGDDQKSVKVTDFQHVCSTAENQPKLSVEKNNGMNLEEQLETNIRRNRDITFEQQPLAFSMKPCRMKTEHHNVMVKHELFNKLQAYQNIKPRVQLPIDKEKGREADFKEQLQYPMQVTKNIQLKTGTRVEMRENWENFENSGPVLWKRGKLTSAGTHKLEKSHTRFNEPQPNLPPPLKSKGNEHLVSDIPSSGKHKNKLAQFVSNSFSKTRRYLSGSRGSRNSMAEGSGAGLSSGYMRKPFSLGKKNEQAALRDSQLLRWGFGSGANKDESSDTSPAKSPEINQMWDYIDHHARQWSNVEDSPPPPNHEQQSPNRQVSPSKRKPQSPPKSGSPKSKSVSSPDSAGPRVLNSKEDKDAHHLIKRHKKGWTTPDGIPAADASSSSPEKDSLSENPKSLQSSSASHSSGPPGRSMPYSNSRRKVRQPSHKELDAQYEAYITRVRSRDGHEKK